MASMTMIQALRSAMDVMLGRDDNVVVFGEDVGYFGGVFRCTQGLQQKYGTSRCFDTPISELGIVGAAIGMAAYGLRPCVEVQFADYVYPAYDQIVSEAARLRYRSQKLTSFILDVVRLRAKQKWRRYSNPFGMLAFASAAARAFSQPSRKALSSAGGLDLP